MSAFYAPVVAYRAEEHPNADALEMAVVGGWRAACRIGQFTEGQKVAYIPEQALLPRDLIVEMGLADPPRLAGSKHNRVKPIRLRGELSQGLVYGGDRITDLEIGDDAVEALGLVKWEPPVRITMGGHMIPGPKIGFDIDNIKSWPDRLVVGEEVVITEKLHGTFCCLGLTRQSGVWRRVVSSKGLLGKGLRFDLDAPANADNLYVKAWRRHEDRIRGLFDRFTHQQDGDGAVFAFGEIVGPRIQDLAYGRRKPGFHLFDVRTDQGYVDWPVLAEAARQVGLRTVPLLHVGPWSPELLTRHTDGKSTLADHIREGAVIKPVTTRYDHGQDHPSGRGPGRAVFKSVSTRYLLRKGGTEYE